MSIERNMSSYLVSFPCRNESSSVGGKFCPFGFIQEYTKGGDKVRKVSIVTQIWSHHNATGRMSTRQGPAREYKQRRQSNKAIAEDKLFVSKDLEPLVKKLVGKAKERSWSYHKTSIVFTRLMKAQFIQGEVQKPTTRRKADADMRKYSQMAREHPDIVDDMYNKIVQTPSHNEHGCVFPSQGGPRPTVYVTNQQLKVLDSTSDYQFPRHIKVAHIILMKRGILPRSSSDHASHYCHNSRCLAHVRFESAQQNGAREVCNANKSCSCGLSPKCIFP